MFHGDGSYLESTLPYDPLFLLRTSHVQHQTLPHASLGFAADFLLETSPISTPTRATADQDIYRCFWINVPLAAPIIVLCVLFLRVPQKLAPATWKEIVLQLDLPGFAILMASMICLNLSMQWGGQSKPWSDGSVIATLVLFILFTAAFFAIVQPLQGSRASVPPRLLKPRIIWTNALYSFM